MKKILALLLLVFTIGCDSPSGPSIPDSVLMDLGKYGVIKVGDELGNTEGFIGYGGYGDRVVGDTLFRSYAGFGDTGAHATFGYVTSKWNVSKKVIASKSQTGLKARQ